MNRRLAAAVLTAGALALPGAAADPPKTRLAHVGLELDGGWGYLKLVRAEPDAELVAVAEADPKLHDRARAELPAGVRLFADYEAMLDEMKPAAVTVTAPNSTHLAILKACARRKVHVLVQKPMAATLADAREMERAAGEAGITLQVNYANMLLPDQQLMLSRIKAGELGPVERLVVTNGIMRGSKYLSPTYAAYFRDPARHGGGALMDQGTYGIGWAVAVLGRPEAVYATLRSLPGNPFHPSEDEAWVTLSYPAATAVVQGSWGLTDTGAGGAGEIHAYGPKGSLRRYDGTVWFRPAVANPGDKPTEARPVDVPAPPAARRNGVAYFLDRLRTGKPVEAPHSAGFNVVVSEVTEAAYESARTGREVRLKPAK